MYIDDHGGLLKYPSKDFPVDLRCTRCRKAFPTSYRRMSRVYEGLYYSCPPEAEGLARSKHHFEVYLGPLRVVESWRCRKCQLSVFEDASGPSGRFCKYCGRKMRKEAVYLRVSHAG